MQLRMLEFAKHEMHGKALEAFGELGEDEELGPADWSTIRKYVTCLPHEDESPAHPHAPPSFALPSGEHTKQKMLDTRGRFLNGKFGAFQHCMHVIMETAFVPLLCFSEEKLDYAFLCSSSMVHLCTVETHVLMCEASESGLLINPVHILVVQVSSVLPRDTIFEADLFNGTNHHIRRNGAQSFKRLALFQSPI